MPAEKLVKLRRQIRRDLVKYGTNVEQNDSDPYGDGDQSMFPAGDHVTQQFYRNLYSTGGDINCIAENQMKPLSPFAVSCITGYVTGMITLLQQADTDPTKPSEALIQLLEKRETTQRLSPLMMILSIGKHIDTWEGTSGKKAESQLKAVKLLLEYGARPDARDICGKTVCHYGMGPYATDMTLKAGACCIAAHQSSHLFAQEVELHSLQNAEMNGLRGVCRGYIVSTGRRPVYIFDRQRAVAIKPENLKLANGFEQERPKLCDVQDRMGAVPLLEVLIGLKPDVAKVLLDEHNARIDICDVDGFSPKSMALQPGLGAVASVASIINKHALRLERAEKLRRENSCTNCGRTDVSLLDCAKCHSVQYCTKECQVAHWKQGGHKQECSKLSDQKQETIILEKPAPGGEFRATFNLTTGAPRRPRTAADTFKKPSNVAVDELFYIKIQGGDMSMPLMIYDKTRKFHAYFDPGAPGFDELRAKVVADPSVGGRKTYLKCSFDKLGRCVIYLGTRSVKTW